MYVLFIANAILRLSSDLTQTPFYICQKFIRTRNQNSKKQTQVWVNIKRVIKALRVVQPAMLQLVYEAGDSANIRF